MRFPLLALLLLGSLFSAPPAQADTERKVVKGNSDPVVETSDHTCVRTKWMSVDDPCAPPPPPPPPAPVVMAPPPLPPPLQPRTVIQQEDRTVYFDFNQTVLKPEAQQKLRLLAGVLRGAKDIQRAEIVGFADPIGSKKYNYALSEKRAHKVNDYIRGQGYLKTVVAKVRGVGEDQARASCDDRKKRSERITCLSPDRKVEVEIVYSVEKMP